MLQRRSDVVVRSRYTDQIVFEDNDCLVLAEYFGYPGQDRASNPEVFGTFNES
jgi:hypothetical protein